MDFDIRRVIYFLGFCITSRSVLTWLVWKYPDLASKVGLLALLPVIGWLYIYFVSPRDTGAEVFGGKIWWNYLRVPHAMLWSITALYTQRHKSIAWIPLMLDTVLGLTSWLYVNYDGILSLM